MDGQLCHNYRRGRPVIVMMVFMTMGIVMMMVRHRACDIRKVTRPDGDIAGRVDWDRREDGREAGADLKWQISRRRRP